MSALLAHSHWRLFGCVDASMESEKIWQRRLSKRIKQGLLFVNTKYACLWLCLFLICFFFKTFKNDENYLLVLH